MSGKFAALAADVSQSFQVVIIDPVTEQPVTDKDGNQAYVEIFSADSDEGRKFDREQRIAFQRKAVSGRNRSVAEEDGQEANIAKLARLTKSWLLIDPQTKEKIDVPCTAENAVELYSGGGTAYIFRQVWLGANEPANFIRRSSKIS